MADLKVDYQVLEFTHATLSRLASQFDGMQTQQAQYDRAMGSGDIAGAMDNFAGNWAIHRRQLIGKMQDLDQMVAAALREFPKTDSQLANSLTKK
jgi:hypothetical protein